MTHEIASVVCDETHTSFSWLWCSGSWLCVSTGKETSLRYCHLPLFRHPNSDCVAENIVEVSIVDSWNIRSFCRFRLLRHDRVCLCRENTQAPYLDARCDFNHIEL